MAERSINGLRAGIASNEEALSRMEWEGGIASNPNETWETAVAMAVSPEQASRFRRKLEAFHEAFKADDWGKVTSSSSPEALRRSAGLVALRDVTGLDLLTDGAAEGRSVRNGAIAKADIAASKIAVQYGPRIPGVNGNGKT